MAIGNIDKPHFGMTDEEIEAARIRALSEKDSSVKVENPLGLTAVELAAEGWRLSPQDKESATEGEK